MQAPSWWSNEARSWYKGSTRHSGAVVCIVSQIAISMMRSVDADHELEDSEDESSTCSSSGSKCSYERAVHPYTAHRLSLSGQQYHAPEPWKQDWCFWDMLVGYYILFVWKTYSAVTFSRYMMWETSLPRKSLTILTDHCQSISSVWKVSSVKSSTGFIGLIYPCIAHRLSLSGWWYYAPVPWKQDWCS